MWLQGSDVARCEACDLFFFCICLFLYLSLSLSLHLSSAHKVMIRQSADVAPGL